jgi:topoisomerase-4 subunit A
MESLFKLTVLEVRIPLNMNVLSRGVVPKVMSLGAVLKEWLAHRREVLRRRSEHRLAAIRRRLEILDGYLIAYLNLDEVIRIIRYEDEPKQELMKAFGLNDVQAEAILNMRLRNLRKLEEAEIRGEHGTLSEERDQIEALLASEDKQWKTIAWEIGEVRKTFGPDTKLGRRRTTLGAAPAHEFEDMQAAMIEREPITVVVSEKGWIRALKGHLDDFARLDFKQGDRLRIGFKAETTDRILVVSTAGRVFTLEASKLPGGRSQGEPIRIQVDMDEDQDVLDVFVHKPDRRLMIATRQAKGFIVAEAELVAQTRKGKQVVNVAADDAVRLVRTVPPGATHVATIGDNRKLLVFPIEHVAEMTRGSGVRLQRFKDGGLADLRCFVGTEGLTWTDSAGRGFTRSLADLADWLGNRADAGRLPPAGFPKTNRFDPG